MTSGGSRRARMLRRNCNAKLDNLGLDRRDPDGEPQQSRGTPAILTWTRQGFSRPVEGCEVQTYLATDLAKSRVSSRVRSTGGNHELPCG
jgi:hypothetical protein